MNVVTIISSDRSDESDKYRLYRYNGATWIFDIRNYRVSVMSRNSWHRRRNLFMLVLTWFIDRTSLTVFEYVISFLPQTEIENDRESVRSLLTLTNVCGSDITPGMSQIHRICCHLQQVNRKYPRRSKDCKRMNERSVIIMMLISLLCQY